MEKPSALDRYAEKLKGWDSPSLRGEIAQLEYKIVKVAGELYALDTSDDQNGSIRSKISIRENNLGTWEGRLDRAVRELTGRGERYTPTEEYGGMLSVAADIVDAVRVVYAYRDRNGVAGGVDLVLRPEGMLARASGYGPFNVTTRMIGGDVSAALLNTLLNNRAYTWGGSYDTPGSCGREVWMLDIYTLDGGCISFRGGSHRPHNFEQVRLALSALSMIS